MTSSYSTRGTESYASIVEAIRADILRSSGAPAKDYEYNFKGITQALQALTIEAQAGPGSEISPQPSGGNVIINDQGDPEWIVSTQPADGTLWFDTRQGRLFIAYQNEWCQTNGGDGLPCAGERTKFRREALSKRRPSDQGPLPNDIRSSHLQTSCVFFESPTQGFCEIPGGRVFRSACVRFRVG